MSEENTKSKTPTWVGTVVESKDAEIEAEKEKTAYMREMAAEQREWMERQIEREKSFLEGQLRSAFDEREARSKTLYSLSEADRDSKDSTIKRLWLTIIVLIAAVLTMAGKEIGMSVPSLGSFSSKGAPTTEKKGMKAKKKGKGARAPGEATGGRGPR